jgi:hypothetical protein
MPDTEFDLPFFTDYGWMFGLLFVSVLFLHWALVYQWPLGKTAWKRVDYIWVSFAIFGVMGGISESRQMLARGTLTWANTRLTSVFEQLRSESRIMSGTSGFCRSFNRTEMSPPPGEMERLEREYGQACKWIKELSSGIPTSPTEKIDTRYIESAPQISTPELSQWTRGIIDRAATFNYLLDRRASLMEKSSRTSVEQLIVLFASILLIFALALRLTKVTGEIRLDRG